MTFLILRSEFDGIIPAVGWKISKYTFFCSKLTTILAFYWCLGHILFKQVSFLCISSILLTVYGCFIPYISHNSFFLENIKNFTCTSLRDGSWNFGFCLLESFYWLLTILSLNFSFFVCLFGCKCHFLYLLVLTFLGVKFRLFSSISFDLVVIPIKTLLEVEFEHFLYSFLPPRSCKFMYRFLKFDWAVQLI